MTKSARIFEMIELIRTRPGKLGVEELSKSVGVSKRGIYRYLLTLRQAGIGVRLNGGGYVLVTDHWRRLLSKRKLLTSMAELLKIGMENCEDKKLLKQGQRVLRQLGT